MTRRWSMIPTDEYEPQYSLVSYRGPQRDLTKRYLPRKMSHHALMMLDFWSAMDAWLLEREAVAMGYETEEAEFKLEHPCPHLGDYMKEQWRYSLEFRTNYLHEEGLQ